VQLEDMTLISIDDHIVEPPDLFDGRLPRRFADRAPKAVTFPDGSSRWMYQDYEVGSNGLMAVASWPPEEWSPDQVGFADMRPGCYAVDERVADMNADGVLASLCFPTFVGFAGNHLGKAPDLEVSTAVVSAYNDWHLDGWAAAHPGRFIPMGILPLWDAGASVKEIHRLADRGFTAVTLPDTPYSDSHNRLPSYYSDFWEPIFAALCDEDMTACLHIGGAFNLVRRPADAPLDQRIILSPQMSAIAAVDLIVAGVFGKFPTLRVAMSEGGIGWVPVVLERIDFNLINQTWSDWNLGGLTGTDVWRRNFLGCFIQDQAGLNQWERIGIDTIAWECDYPHSDSSWPRSAEKLWPQLQQARLSDDQIEKVTWQNSARFFRFDAHAAAGLSREQATVGALRARAGDIDVSTTSKSEYRRRFEAAAALG
jgi:predicted TIM-barrel fold metal-dependent hydrolase